MTNPNMTDFVTTTAAVGNKYGLYPSGQTSQFTTVTIKTLNSKMFELSFDPYNSNNNSFTSDLKISYPTTLIGSDGVVEFKVQSTTTSTSGDSTTTTIYNDISISEYDDSDSASKATGNVGNYISGLASFLGLEGAFFLGVINYIQPGNESPTPTIKLEIPGNLPNHFFVLVPVKDQ